ncbi:MAG: helicase associated domain-containing protein, partial [Pseudonocardiaceae bacterium]
ASLAEFAADSCARRRRGLLPAHLARAAQRLPAWRWDLIPAADAAMVDALAEYAAWRGDFNVAHDYRHDDGLALGSWLTAVRRRRFTGRLAPALEHELVLACRHQPDAAALRWEAADTAWRLGLLALRQYVARQGRCRVPRGHVEALADHEVGLSRWCVVQRQAHRHGRLSAHRVAALEQVDGWRWEVELREGYRPVLDTAQHATRAGYAKGCRCDPCTDANRSFEHDRANGAGTDLVCAATARGHLRILTGRAATHKALARAAGLNVKTITEVADGTLARIRPETHTAILALTMHAAADATRPGRWASVPAGPTWQLLDDMIARGWPKAWIAREIGHDGAALQLHRDRVSAANAAAVAQLDSRLGRRRPPPRRWRAPLPPLDELLAAEGTQDRGEAS